MTVYIFGGLPTEGGREAGDKCTLSPFSSPKEMERAGLGGDFRRGFAVWRETVTFRFAPAIGGQG